MYIRRKVFSVFEDEMGEERLYSTSEYVLGCYENDIYDSEERYFSEDDEEKNRKGKKVAKAAGITAGSAVAAGAATYGGSKALNKIMQNKYDKIAGDSEAIAKLDNSTIGKINKKAANLTAKVEDLPHGAKDAAGKLWDTTTKTWKSASDFAKVSAEKIKDGTVDATGKVWNKTKGAWESISKAANTGKRGISKAWRDYIVEGKKFVEVPESVAGEAGEVVKAGLGKHGNRAVLVAAPLAAAAATYGGVKLAKAHKAKKEDKEFSEVDCDYNDTEQREYSVDWRGVGKKAANAFKNTHEGQRIMQTVEATGRGVAGAVGDMIKAGGKYYKVSFDGAKKVLVEVPGLVSKGTASAKNYIDRAAIKGAKAGIKSVGDVSRNIQREVKEGANFFHDFAKGGK